jgi:hypothetical protein
LVGSKLAHLASLGCQQVGTLKERFAVRGLEKFIVAAFLGLVVLGVWNVRTWLSDHLALRGHDFVAAPGPTAVVPTIKSRSGSAHGKPGTRSGTKDTALLPDDVTIVDVPYTGQPFPEPKDLPSGITGAEIRAGFGDPAAHVTLSSNGLLVERYYYVNKERTRYTVAELQDGRLISAASKSN